MSPSCGATTGDRSNVRESPVPIGYRGLSVQPELLGGANSLQTSQDWCSVNRELMTRHSEPERSGGEESRSLPSRTLVYREARFFVASLLRMTAIITVLTKRWGRGCLDHEGHEATRKPRNAFALFVPFRAFRDPRPITFHVSRPTHHKEAICASRSTAPSWNWCRAT